MSRVLLVGHKDVLEQTIEVLHSLHGLHIEEYEDDGYFNIGKPLPGAEQDSKELLKLRSISSFLGIGDPYHRPVDAKQLSSGLEEKLEALDSTVSEKLRRKSDIEANLKDVETKTHDAKPFSGIPIRRRCLKLAE